MPVQPIDPESDSRIEHKTALLNGYTYHYIYAEPKSGEWSKTVFLVRICGFIYTQPLNWVLITGLECTYVTALAVAVAIVIG